MVLLNSKRFVVYRKMSLAIAKIITTVNNRKSPDNTTPGGIRQVLHDSSALLYPPENQFLTSSS